MQSKTPLFVIQSEAKDLVYTHVYALEILRFALNDNERKL